MRRVRQAAGAAVFFASLALAACQPGHTGDFGRRADNVVTNSVLPKAGLFSAWVRGEAVSLYPFTEPAISPRTK